MHTIGLVIKYTIRTTLRKRSFWIMTFIVPAFLIAFQAYNALQSNGRGTTQGGAQATSGSVEGGALAGLKAIGLVDEAGLLQKFPPGFPVQIFIGFADSASARQALKSGQIDQYVVVPANYLSSGQIVIYAKNFQITSSGAGMGVASGGQGESVLTYLINYNLSGSEQIASALRNPTPLGPEQQHAIQPRIESSQQQKASVQVVSTVLPYIFYIVIIIGSGYLLQSVTAEKENRTAEVLLLSVNPRDLMAGKLIGLGIIILVQAIFWLGAMMLVMQRGTSMFQLSAYSFPPGFAIWAGVYLILGYLVYGSTMAAGGAIAPNAREGGQITWLLVIPFIPVLMFASEFADNPNGALAVILSLFPFSAPSAMPTRLAVTQVPAWQLAISLAGMVGTAYLFVLLAARFFRADNLLSAVSFSWRRMANGLRRTE